MNIVEAALLRRKWPRGDNIIAVYNGFVGGLSEVVAAKRRKGPPRRLYRVLSGKTERVWVCVWSRWKLQLTLIECVLNSTTTEHSVALTVGIASAFQQN